MEENRPSSRSDSTDETFNDTEEVFTGIGEALIAASSTQPQRIIRELLDTSDDEVFPRGLSNTEKIARLQELAKQRREREDALLDQQERDLEAQKEALDRERSETKALEELKQAEEAAAQARFLRAQALREREKELAQEQRLLTHRKDQVEKGNPGTGTDVWGRKAFMDIDGRQFSVRDVKVASQEAMESLFSRRVTDAGRHRELFGSEGLTLDATLTFKKIAQMGTLQLFGIRTMDPTYWASPTKYDKISHLPVMSLSGTTVFQKGFCTDLRWFLPANWGNISTLYGIVLALEQMELVYMVQASVEFEGMNRPFLRLTETEMMREADVPYLIHWLQSALDEFNEILRGRYLRGRPTFPEDLLSVHAVKRLWITMIGCITEFLSETKFRLFKERKLSPAVTNFSMKEDSSRAAAGSKDHKITRQHRVDDSSDEEDDDNDSNPEKNPRKTTPRKRKSKKKEAVVTPAKKVKVDQPPAETSPTPSRSLCGTHLMKLAGLGDACEHDPCRFTHASSLNSVNLDSLEACLHSNFGVKTGKAKCIKLWNVVCTRTKTTGRNLQDSHVFEWEAGTNENQNEPSQTPVGGRGRGGNGRPGRGATGRGRGGRGRN
jgi:hypothetical protein